VSRDYAHLVLLTLIAGFTAVFGALIDLPAVEIVLFRTALAVVMLGVLVRLRKIEGTESHRKRLVLVATGALIGVHWILFFLSVKLANVSVCLVALATTALMTSFLKPLFPPHSKIRGREIVCGLLALGSVVLIFGFQNGHAVGFAVGLGSAFFAALFNLINERLTGDQDHRIIAFWEMLGAVLICLMALPLSATGILGESAGLDLGPSPMDLVWLLVLSGVCTVYAFSAYVELLRRLSAYTVVLFWNLEPLFGIALGFLLFQEHQHLGPGFFAGALLIMSSMLVYGWLEQRDHRGGE